MTMNKYTHVLIVILVGISLFSPFHYFNIDSTLANNEPEAKATIPLYCPSGTRYIDTEGFLAICPTDKKPVVNVLYEKIIPIIKDTPMEVMAADIAKREKPVAALVAAIA